MKRALKGVVICALIAPMFVQPALSADVVRCNFKVANGDFRPAVLMVSKRGSKHVFLGQEGLTRKIFYRDSRLKKYVAAKFGLHLPRTYGAINNRCGVAQEEDPPEARPDPTPEAPRPDPTPVVTPTLDLV